MQVLDLINTSSDYEIESCYQYEGKNVPRVTAILSDMLHEDYLMKWSNNIGLYQHKKYNVVLETSSTIGTLTHNAIEDYIKYGKEPDFDSIDIIYKNSFYNAFNSFKKWWDVIIKNEYKILMEEVQLVCKYFGGTLDLLIEINGKTYLVDFKTSNHPSYKYTLQLSAYRYMLNQLYNIKVDGCILLMLSKTDISFDEIFYNFDNKEMEEYFNYCEECFLSLVYAYYNRIRVQSLYNNI